MNALPLEGIVAVVTGGAGMFGQQHALAIAAAGGIPVLADLPGAQPERIANEMSRQTGARITSCAMDVTDARGIALAAGEIERTIGAVSVLVNNAARNPKVEGGSAAAFTRLENFSEEEWDADLNVGLKGAFLCAREFGTRMAARGKGSIVNIASDLALIAPDQRLYRRAGLPADQQPVKPVTYSVVKSGLIGLTRYLATYWADRGVRANAISPGGIYAHQPEEFVRRVSQLIPLGRMAKADEFRAALVFLCSDQSSYMTGSNLVLDGGRSCW